MDIQTELGIHDRDAKIEQLSAAGKELCEAIDEVICWYSSGFAPQSQANAYKRAQEAKARFNRAL